MFNINDRLSILAFTLFIGTRKHEKNKREHNVSFKVDEPSDRETLKIVYYQNKE